MHRSVRLVRSLVVATGVLALVGSTPGWTQTGIGVRKSGVRVVKFDVSPPLRSMKPARLADSGYGQLMADPGEVPEQVPGTDDADPVVQTWANWLEIPTPTVSFNGPGNLAGVSPPDPVGDIGPNHYVAMSNLFFQIFDRSGATLFGPAANNTLWAGFGGDCQTDNSGDPVVVYDQLADRWFLTQFTSSGPTYFNCVAVSTTPDPTGSYFRYAISTGTNFPDYPKYGIWPDALYLSTREFAGASFAGVGAYAINRAQLIAGNPAPQVISFLVTPAAAGGAFNLGDGLLPSDLDGSTPPPAGSPNYFIGSMDNGGPYGAPQDALTIWRFHADFVTPAASTFALANTVPIAPYDTIFNPCGGTRSCIPQPGTSNRLDILSYRQRPMYRAAYRNFGTHESIVTNQSVEAVANIAGIRWWEIRSPGSSPIIFQEGTYAPGATDGVHRWMGSIAMDQNGDMALGYSASDGTSTFPSVWYTGRLASDPLGTMPQGEASIIDGTGSQTSSQRWGDYTSMNVDPVDDCTFWFVDEWVPTSSPVGWQLRIGAFRFPECGTSCPAGTVPNVLYEYGFESGAGGWTVSGTGGSMWTLSGTKPHTGSTSYFADDIASVSDQRLVSPSFALPTGQSPLTFQFWNDQEIEDSGTGCYDGGIIEISTNGGGTWTQLQNAVLETDPYDGVVSSSFQNPLAGLNAWCGDPQPYLNSVVNLDAYAGMTVQMRIRFGTDNSVNHPGWYVDDVLVQGCMADTMPFLDGFESGDTSAWSSTVP